MVDGGKEEGEGGGGLLSCRWWWWERGRREGRGAVGHPAACAQGVSWVVGGREGRGTDPLSDREKEERNESGDLERKGGWVLEYRE